MTFTTRTADAQQDREVFAVRHRISGRETLVVLLVTTAVVIAGSAVAWDGTVPAWEESILHFVNDWPDWLEPIMWVLQQVGNIVTPVITAVVIYVLTRKWQLALPFLLIVPLKLGIEKAIVKQLVERTRPFESVGPEVNVRGPGFHGLSFPSGHTTTAFATGFLLAAILPPRWRAIPVVWAFIVAIARLYYGEHNFLDVVVGAAIGIAFATVLWYLLLNRLAPETDLEAA